MVDDLIIGCWPPAVTQHDLSITFLLRILHLYSLLLEYSVTTFGILNTVVTIESHYTPVSY